MRPDLEIGRCRICSGKVFEIYDCGDQPLANRYLSNPGENFEVYRVSIFVCSDCATAQLAWALSKEQLFTHYEYLTPTSKKLNNHYSMLIDYLLENNILNSGSKVLEIGSNNGAFLTEIKPRAKQILGVEPAGEIASIAIHNGIPTVNDFFSERLAKEIQAKYGRFDLVIARHCLAHNEDVMDILYGIPKVLAENATFLVENSYWPSVVRGAYYDQFYHEHIYYHSVRSIRELVKKIDLQIIDVLPADVQGGSMIYIINSCKSQVYGSQRVEDLLQKENNLHTVSFYKNLKERIENNISDLVETIADILSKGHNIHAYGASAKATVLLNAAQLTHKEIPVVVDSTLTKIGKYLPKSGIKIISEDEANRHRPDYYLITSWNYAEEIIEKVQMTGNANTKFILPHPSVHITE